MSLTPEKMKEMLLAALDMAREKIVEHTIGNLKLEIDNKVTPIYKPGQREPTSVISTGFGLSFDVTYLDQEAPE